MSIKDKTMTNKKELIDVNDALKGIRGFAKVFAANKKAKSSATVLQAAAAIEGILAVVPRIEVVDDKAHSNFTTEAEWYVHYTFNGKLANGKGQAVIKSDQNPFCDGFMDHLLEKVQDGEPYENLKITAVTCKSLKHELVKG